MSKIINNPLLNDTVIERDYGIDELTNNIDSVKEEKIQETKKTEINEHVNEPVNEFNPADLEDMGIHIPQMSFDDDGQDDISEEEIPKTDGYEVKATIESVKPLASVITGIIAEYLPKIGGSIAKQNMTEIKTAVAIHKLPVEFIGFFEEQNKIIEESLQISRSNLKEFNKALIAYLRTKKIETTSPLMAVIIQGGVIGAELVFNSISASAKMSKMKEEIYAKFNINQQ